jgi:chaperonin GroES
MIPAQSVGRATKKVEPLFNMLLVRRAKLTSEGSKLVMPDSMKQTGIMSGEVVAVGPGIYQNGVLVPTQVKKGDKVYFRMHVHLEIDIDGERLGVMSETEVAAVERA